MAVPSAKQLRKPVGGHRVNAKNDRGPVGGRNLGLKAPQKNRGVRPNSTPKIFRPTGQLGRAVQGKDPYKLRLNVAGLQHYLRNLGYHVSVDGKLGPVTKNALKDAILSGTIKHPSAAQAHAVAGVKGRDIGPKAFDSMLSNAGKGPAAPLTGKGGQIKGNGNTNFNAHGGGGGGNGGGNGNGGGISSNPIDKAMKSSKGSPISTSDANFGQLYNVDPTAKAMADEQFGAQINDQQLQVNKDPLQNATNEKDVSDWYNQVLGAQQKAGTADTAATKAGVDSTNQATQALVQSLGGSANLGAGEAAAAGQNASGTLQAMGQAQSGLDAELQPILQAQAAQQKTNQFNTDQQKQQADQQALQDLQGQEGNAQVAAQVQLQDSNNSLDQARQQALQNILEYNNSLKEQNYQNQLGLLTTKAAAAMDGVDIAQKSALANEENAAAQKDLSGGAGMSASQENDVTKALLSAMQSQGLITSTANGYQMASGQTPAQLQSFAKNYISGYGAMPSGYVGSALSGIAGY